MIGNVHGLAGINSVTAMVGFFNFVSVVESIVWLGTCVLAMYSVFRVRKVRAPFLPLTVLVSF
jgi:hypothetical protein